MGGKADIAIGSRERHVSTMRLAIGCVASAIYFVWLGYFAVGVGLSGNTTHFIGVIVIGFAIYALIGTAIERRWFRRG